MIAYFYRWLIGLLPRYGFFCDPMVFLGLLHFCLHLIQDNYGFLGAGGNKKLSLLNNISD